MRICVPTTTDDGLDAEVHGHFGSAPFFSLLDTETGTVEVLTNTDSRHEHGQCNPVGNLMGVDLDAVVVRGMGRNALARLSAAGIAVYVATGATLAEVWSQARTGTLRPLDPAGACAGHAHAGPHHHHHQA